MMYRYHDYAGLEDMDAMLGLVSKSWRRDGPRVRFHVGDVYWFLGTGREEPPDKPYSSICLWTTPTGDAVGFAWLDGTDVGDVLVHPDHRHRGIEEEMINWLEERHQSSIKDQVAASRFQIGGYQDDKWRQLLTERGYVRDELVEGTPRFSRSLNAIEEPVQFEGIEIRNVAGEHEATKRTMVQRAAFASLDFQMPGVTGDSVPSIPDESEINRRTRIYKNVMRLSGYRQELDLVAVTDDGEFVACCTCWLDSENKVGEFEPVGSLPAFRRRGLMRAVMTEGLHRLKSLGAKSAVVGTNAFNLPSIRLYESCGFQVVFMDPIYRKAFVY
jgi:ribosomal protein S18 acetylase RimI-like enzyme